MEMDRDRYEKQSQLASLEHKSKITRQKENEQKWEALNRRLGIEANKPLFPLVLWKPPEGFEDDAWW